MNITDIVRVKKDNRRVRVDGFYRVGQNRGGHAMLIPCLPDDPRCAAVSTYAVCGEFHQPFALELVGPVGWPEDHIRDERERQRRSVESFDPWNALSERDYPGLLRPFLEISNHDRLLLEEWRRAQAALFAGSATAPETCVPAGAGVGAEAIPA